MAVAPAINIGGLRALQRDLLAMAPDSWRELREVIRDSMEPMLSVAKAQAGEHAQTGELERRWHARVAGTRAALVNTLPQARPLEFGGTIAPRGAPIKLPVVGMIYGPDGALERGKTEVQERLLTGFPAFARRHGWH